MTPINHKRVQYGIWDSDKLTSAWYTVCMYTIS